MSMIALLLIASQLPHDPPDVQDTYSAWGWCVAERRSELASGPGTPGSVTDAAFAACAGQEEAMRRALTRAFGSARARAMVAGHRARSRALGLRSVAQRRGGPPVTDSDYVWGQCIGGRVVELAAGADTPDAIIDAALASCTEQERAVQSDSERLMGSERASAHMASLRRQMREPLTRAIADLRARRP